MEAVVLGVGGIFLGGILAYFRSGSKKTKTVGVTLEEAMTNEGWASRVSRVSRVDPISGIDQDHVSKMHDLLRRSYDPEKYEKVREEVIEKIYGSNSDGPLEEIEDPPSCIISPMVSSIDALRKVEPNSYLKISEIPAVTVKFLHPNEGVSRKFHYYKEKKPVKCKGNKVCKICQWARTLAECNQFSAFQRVKAVERHYYNVLVRSDTHSNGLSSHHGRVKVLSVGRSLHQKITEQAKANYGRIEKDFVIRREMRDTGFQSFPDYSKSEFTAKFPIANLQKNVNSILSQRYDLNQIAKEESTEEEIENMLELLREEFAPEENV
ncbi:MAG: hypothetical protein ACW99G_12020 [Candidatus Thorarchaeota archaeon]|jgi:hypothetical protein